MNLQIWPKTHLTNAKYFVGRMVEKDKAMVKRLEGEQIVKLEWIEQRGNSIKKP